MCSGGCEVRFHTKCIKSDLEGKKTRSYKDWKCKSCRTLHSTQPNVSTEPNDEILCKISLELASLRSEMREISTSMQFLSDKTDSSNVLMNEIKQELTLLRKENEELRTKNSSLTSDVRELQDRVRSLEQYTRKNNVEISGLPTTPNEDLMGLLKDVGKSIGVELDESHISASHRIPSYNKSRTPAIIVQFQRRALKDTWISKYKEVRNLTAKQVNKLFPDQRVYISDHLSPENKQFLSKLKHKCKEIGYKFAWSRDGKFFVRKNEGEKCLKIVTNDDIERLK